MTLTIRVPAGNETAQTKAAALSLLRPPPSLTVSQWADRYRFLSRKDSARPGRWRSEPHQRAIMDAFNDPTVREVIVKAASQVVGKSQMMNNVIGYFVDQDPSNMMVLHPTLSAAEKWSKGRLDPLIEETPQLFGKFPRRKARDGDNTILHRQFRGGQMFVVGSNAPADLAAQSVRILLADEVDRYEASAGTEGDPIDLGKQRTETYGAFAKFGAFSTPLLAGSSRIDASYQESDKREWRIRCPHCRRSFAPLWEHVAWAKGAQGEHLPDTAHMVCPGCGTAWSEPDRMRAIDAGEWVATAPFTGIAGFHISALGCKRAGLAKLVRRFIAAGKNHERLKAFTNLVLAETWRIAGESVEPDNLFARREARPYGDVPMGVLFLTAGVDVQRDRIEAYIWGWGRDRRCWLIDFRVFRGKPSQPEVWKELDDLLLETWRHESGVDMRLRRLGIDTGDGLYTSPVYQWCWRHGGRVVMPVKGASRQERMDASVPVKMSEPVSLNAGGRRKRSDLRVALIATGVFKSELMASLRLDLDDDGSAPPGWISLPRSADMDVCQQLVAEELVLAPKKHGPAAYEWRKRQARNEALDCFVYARAAAWMLGVDRWSEAKWRDAEAALGLLSDGAPSRPARKAPEAPAEAREAPAAALPPPAAAPRASMRPGFLGSRRGSWLR